MKIVKNKQGNSIIELIVGMGLFATVMTITVGFFIVIVKLEDNYKRIVNIHQEGRIVSEIFTRTIREAKSVSITSTPSAGVNICWGSGTPIYMTSADGLSWVQFKCEYSDGAQRFRMSSGKVGVDDPNATPVNNITSERVRVNWFTVFRPTPATYPKTLMYKMEIEDNSGGNSLGEGGKLYLKGFIEMRNEQ